MTWSVIFFVNSILLGAGLSMDAFSVAMANGLNEPCMKKNKMLGIAGVFAFFQAAMPLLGWVCVHSVVKYFGTFENYVPWIALILLCFIGGKMIYDGKKNKNVDDVCPGVGVGALLLQGIATSIDALSVGFTIAEYNFTMAFAAALIIAVVTFILCVCGVLIGKKFGTVLAGKATVIGGVILIGIGIEIFISGMFG